MVLKGLEIWNSVMVIGHLLSIVSSHGASHMNIFSEGFMLLVVVSFLVLKNI